MDVVCHILQGAHLEYLVGLGAASLLVVSFDFLLDLFIQIFQLLLHTARHITLLSIHLLSLFQRHAEVGLMVAADDLKPVTTGVISTGSTHGAVIAQQRGTSRFRPRTQCRIHILELIGDLLD